MTKWWRWRVFRAEKPPPVELHTAEAERALKQERSERQEVRRLANVARRAHTDRYAAAVERARRGK
jgi:hypothetical protein